MWRFCRATENHLSRVRCLVWFEISRSYFPRDRFSVSQQPPTRRARLRSADCMALERVDKAKERWVVGLESEEANNALA